MYKYLFLILFGIILFLYNNFEGFSIGGLHVKLYEVDNDGDGVTYLIQNLDGGGAIQITDNMMQVYQGNMDPHTFQLIQRAIRDNPNIDPRTTHQEVFSDIDSMKLSYQSQRSELTEQLVTKGLDDKVIEKILDVYFKKYFESLKEYFKLEKQLCSATYTSTFEDSSTYDLDVLFGERDPYTMSLNDRLLLLNTDLFRKIFREKLITVNLDYSFFFGDLIEFLHTYGDYYGFSGSGEESDSDDEESEEYLTEQEFVNIFSLFIAVLLSRGYELQMLMEFIIDELDTEIPDILHSYHRNDYITISEIIIRIFLDKYESESEGE
jgi:hypothetical protein